MQLLDGAPRAQRGDARGRRDEHQRETNPEREGPPTS
jgi:hypothetical protein